MMQRSFERWLMLLLLASCAEAKFTGDTPQRAQQSLDPPALCTSGGSECTPPPLPPVAPTCSEVPVGADLAFLIDNSSSNEVTDCPRPRATSRTKPNGTAIFSCDAETNREKAVLAGYDLLNEIAMAYPGEAEARSRLAVVSFPVQENAGMRAHFDWRETSAQARASLVAALRFARAPWGQTPFGDGFQGALRLFETPMANDRQKVIILVTDGFPTDSNPAAVLGQVEALRGQGIKVLTVRVTGPETRAQREAEHRAMLAAFDARSRREQGRSWYNTQVYDSFDAYLSAALRLGEQVAGGEVVEVADSSALSRTIVGLIGKVLRCQP